MLGKRLQQMLSKSQQIVCVKLQDFRLFLLTSLHLVTVARGLNCVGVKYFKVPKNGKPCAIPFLLLIGESAVFKKKGWALAFKNHWQLSNVGLLALRIWLGCINKNAALGAMSVNVKEQFEASGCSRKSFF